MVADLREARWFKSSRSSGGRECVEVAFLDGGQVGVRDSKNPDGPALVFAASEWDAFAAGVRDGEFNPSA
ncbi:hypothetical protein BJY24_001353 [Nocardia transvalensis]|uniref:DUF397 domain-containing protein n=1 Tax=Nocardia transvalensis TaxID=37333 RepID=A0A7W9PAM7_9NOCA|nr:DUF397 domain-containing protein [Nocardia transvalensis]MBB5912486.1 hypothetical protein [Nocardia transvalensis]